LKLPKHENNEELLFRSHFSSLYSLFDLLKGKHLSLFYVEKLARLENHIAERSGIKGVIALVKEN
jgi:hypothetical protein